ncbi:Lrp/AsnC family transcriptional regulator [Thalassomonas viridans]|uniref:siroheme decarboxylase n=1 Tax=Thalassomonas viridans TaxID=137584 RepID=A0AAF0CCD4_9GAMM|nr:Lrp/AsnC family transcriptional regulator [Thalassomonas viridans]WDE07800.1 Lrp/AsnC family transcriptional regulator [Thalassomonas viridans]
MNLSLLQQQLINRCQRGFPLESSPYARLAEELGSTEAEVLAALKELEQADILSRLGAVFDHKKAGASTLAALAVPEADLDYVAGIINNFDQVNHNYAREHDYNLWFVVTAADDFTLNRVLTRIEELTGLEVLVLPMEKAFHIDLSFQIDFEPAPQITRVN